MEHEAVNKKRKKKTKSKKTKIAGIDGDVPLKSFNDKDFVEMIHHNIEKRP